MRTARVCSFSILLLTLSTLAQNPPSESDPYKPVLDRLQSVSTIPLESWRGHVLDLAHGEDPGLNVSGWDAVQVKKSWTPASRWVRSSIILPDKLNGYALQDSRVKLDLVVDSNQEINVTTFVNGNMVDRTDGEGQIPFILTEKAQPGQKFDIAVRIIAWGGMGCCGGEPNAQLSRAQLLIEPPAARPDPAIFRLEVLSAEPLIAAYEDGKAQRQQQLDAAVKAVDIRRPGQRRSAGLRQLAA